VKEKQMSDISPPPTPTECRITAKVLKWFMESAQVEIDGLPRVISLLEQISNHEFNIFDDKSPDWSEQLEAVQKEKDG
jgi:hypothetical protein